MFNTKFLPYTLPFFKTSVDVWHKKERLLYFLLVFTTAVTTNHIAWMEIEASRPNFRAGIQNPFH